MDCRPPSSATIMNGTPHPDVGGDRGEQRGPAVGVPRHRFDAQLRQRGVDQAELLVEQEPPGERGDERGDRPRHDQRHPVDRPAPHLAVEQDRQPQAERVVEQHAGERPHEGVGELQPELAAVAAQHVDVVVDADELRRLRVRLAGLGAAEHLGADLAALVRLVEVGERLVHALHERVEHEHAEAATVGSTIAHAYQCRSKLRRRRPGSRRVRRVSGSGGAVGSGVTSVADIGPPGNCRVRQGASSAEPGAPGPADDRGSLHE